MLAVIAILLVVAYAVTPYSALGSEGMPLLVRANTRYGVPALVASAPILAWAVGRLPRARPLAEAVLLLAILLGLHDNLPVDRQRLLAGIVVAGAAALAAVRLRDPRLVAGVAAALALVAVAAGRHQERAFATAAYEPPDATVTRVLATAPAGRRIALTGVWSASGLVPTAALFGPRFRNRVDFLGPYADHLRGVYTDEDAFLRALGRGHYDLLEIGRGSPPVSTPREERWARRAGWRVVVRSPRLVLLRHW
jgi:hypothetical protein